jgi:hypothetical protein
VFQADLDNLINMLIIEGIEGHLTLFPVLDQPGLPEAFQLMGDGGLLHFQDR